MRVFIDADACPVKAEALKVAARYGLHTFIVSNGGMRPDPNPAVTVVAVPSGADAADDWIAERVGAGDIAITADIPLAKRVLDAGAQALGPTGKAFDHASIGMALAVRDLKQHLREANQSQTYNRSFGASDRSNFLQALDRMVVKNRQTSR